MADNPYLYAGCPAVGGEPDLGALRGLAIADAHARWRRARGEDVLLGLGFDTFATTPKPADGEDGREWVAGRRAAWRELLERLELSVDWERVHQTADPAFYRWTQQAFTALLDAELAYRRGGRGWFLRSSAFHAENDRRIDRLSGWSDGARAAQRALLQRVDGHELDGRALDGAELALFTAHPDRIADAAFVGLSAQLPEVDAWTGADDGLRARVERLRDADWSDRAADELPVVEVGVSAQVPGVPQPLPILVSPAVDARFGPAAIVGVPDADPVDAAMAKGLASGAGLAWKMDAPDSEPRPAVRFLAPDMPLSRGRAWGAPVPVVHCGDCGAVPVPAGELPLELPADVDVAKRGNALAEHAEFRAADCPRCGGEGERDPGTLHPRLGAALMELALAAAPLDGAALADRLPTTWTVADPESAATLLDQRTVAKALRDAGAFGERAQAAGGDGEGFPADGEPHGPTLVHPPFELADAPAPAELIATHGADAVRFALLHAARPAKRFAARGDGSVRQAAALLDELRAFAEPRLADAPPAGDDPVAAIDRGDGLRRRLARWCETAVARSDENHERLDLHRATRNAVELLRRIQDFERRVTEHRGEVAGADRAAAACAVAALVGIVAPLAPALAARLRAPAGAGAT